MGNPTSTPTPPKKPQDETVLERIYEGEAGESTGSNIRYAGYAYTSDIGESFRPVAHPWLVRGAYGVSWAYITGDVGYEGYKAYLNNKAVLAGLPPPHPSSHHHSSHPPATTTAATTLPTKIPFLEDYRTLMVQRFIFQAAASMALPAFTIHSVVRYSGRAMKNVQNARIRTWGPVGLGLAVVPALPYLFDEPVEKGVEKAFEILASTVEGAGKGTADKEVVKQREL